MANGNCVLLTVHGSTHAEARAAAKRFEGFLQAQRLECLVRVCFLRTSEPSLVDALEQAGQQGMRRILIVPLFVFPGQHITEEIPAVVERFQQTHPGVTVEVLPALGEIPAFGQWVARLLQECLAGRGW
ncbi:MAG: Sirohydrochlorin cobaltochelatase [Candidatus Ozemobacter sibiricus]|jgi:sirohydrochlorin ferrochelatase|uniref:Sirohydrochlorin cobaltochelatase n=1 Tax=Candidatus Ozemobacter sibiricus TaxID=2268124 RepID=A0A367ZUH8_9BACT|nr:MAG: Sirohydrochlorin cobaltochelatase [Candidatus Ozemobacter sibiricus]